MVTKLAKGLVGFFSTIAFLFPGKTHPEISLNGKWEYCFSKTEALPGPETKWEQIEVPSFIPSQFEAPRAWYRRNFTIPQTMQGKHIRLRFEAVKYRAEIFLNGQKAGSHLGGFEPFEVDISKQARIGKQNELLVCAGDWTTLAEGGINLTDLRPDEWPVERARDNLIAPIGWNYTFFGIWQDVSLCAYEDVYLEDVFVLPSVRNKKITLEITLTNIGGKAYTVELRNYIQEDGKTVKRLASQKVALEPKSSQTVKITENWESPKFWWPHQPHLYYLNTEIAQAGKSWDKKVTRFGFREFWVEGIYAYLNGKKIKLLGTSLCAPTSLKKEEAVQTIKNIQEANCRIIRLHMQPAPKVWYETADELGMLLVCESGLYCVVNSYKLGSQTFWDNAQKHITSMVKTHRNHPSVVIWSVENEFLLCGGMREPRTETEVANLGKLIKSLDPTRPIMFEGDEDPQGVADIINLHYPHESPRWNLFPQTAFWLEGKVQLDTFPQRQWEWTRKKPLYMGEFSWMPGPTPDPYTVFVGNDAYRGGNYQELEKALCWRMQIQAFRDAEVLGMCPWLAPFGPKKLENHPQWLATKESYEPICVFIREYNKNFFSGSKVTRHLTLHNDILEDSKLTVKWQLKEGNEILSSDQFEITLGSGDAHKTSISFDAPKVSHKTAIELELQVLRDNKLTYATKRTYFVFPTEKPKLAKEGKIALFDLKGETQKILDKCGIKYTLISRLSEMPPNTDLVIIGYLSLPKPEDKMLRIGHPEDVMATLSEFIEKGGKLIVFEQEEYPANLSGLLPLSLSNHSATICFHRAPGHPILKGLEEEDLKFWSPDHIVTKNSLIKPTSGAFRAIVDSGGPGGLIYLGLAELPKGNGLIILNQLQITDKFDYEPAAQIIFQNLLNYALETAPPRRKTGIISDNPNMKNFLNSIKLVYDDLSGKLKETDLSPYGLLIASGSFSELERNIDKISQFVSQGGKLMLHKMDKSAAERLSSLFPKFILQKNTSAPILLYQPDATTAGISNQDLYWTEKHIGKWHDQTPLSYQVADFALSIATPAEKGTTIEAETMEVSAGLVQKAEDQIALFSAGTVTCRLRFPKTAFYSFALIAKGTPAFGVFPQVDLQIDGETVDSVNISSETWDEFYLSAEVKSGEHEITLAFVNDAWNPPKEDRNLWLDKLTYSEAKPIANVVFLTKPAALVKIPHEKGFYLLNEINWDTEERNRDKATRLISTLLTNLGAQFQTEASWTIEAEKMRPQVSSEMFRISGESIFLYANGKIETELEFVTGGKYTFEIIARGSPVKSIYPHIDLLLNDQLIGSADLQTESWLPYPITAEIPPGIHKISLAFTNDTYDPPEDRNLEIDKIRIYK